MDNAKRIQKLKDKEYQEQFGVKKRHLKNTGNT